MQDDKSYFGWIVAIIVYLIGIGVTMLIGGPSVGLTVGGSALFGAIAIPALSIIAWSVAAMFSLSTNWAMPDRMLFIGAVVILLPFAVVWAIAEGFGVSILRTAVLLFVLPCVTFFVAVILVMFVSFSVLTVINFTPSNIRKRREAKQAFERFCERTVDDLCNEIEQRIELDPGITRTVTAKYSNLLLDQLHLTTREFFARFGRLEIKREYETFVIDPQELEQVESDSGHPEIHLALSEHRASFRFGEAGRVQVFVFPKFVEEFPTIHHAIVFILGAAPNSEEMLDY